MGNSMVDVKQGRWTQRRINGALHLMLGGWSPQVNSHDQIVQSGNYSYSSLRVASIDEVKKYSHRKIIMTLTQNIYPNRITFCTSKKGAGSAEVGVLALMFEKSITELKHKQKFLKCKSIINIATFNVRTLNRIEHLSELSVSAQEHNIDIVYVQEHRYYNSVREMKNHNSGKGWMFISASARKNSVNTVVEVIGMLLGLPALK